MGTRCVHRQTLSLPTLAELQGPGVLTQKREVAGRASPDPPAYQAEVERISPHHQVLIPALKISPHQRALLRWKFHRSRSPCVGLLTRAGVLHALDF